MQPSRDLSSRIAITDGVEALFGGATFILTTPRIWPFALVPAAVLTLLWSAFAGLGIWGAVALSDWLIAPPRGTWAGIGYWSLVVLFGVLAILLAALLAMALAQPLSGPALERISIAQQQCLTGTSPPNHGLLKSMWINLKSLGFALAVGGAALIVLFAVDLIFPPAAVVTAPLQFLVGAWILAWDLVDYPLGLRGLGVRARLAWARRNLGAFTVFGLVGAALTVVPGAVVLLLPVGVAGATRLVLRDEPSIGPP